MSLIWIKFDLTENLFNESSPETAIRNYAQTLWHGAQKIDLSMTSGESDKTFFLFSPQDKQNSERMVAIAEQQEQVSYIIGGISNEIELTAPIWQNSLATFQLNSEVALSLLSSGTAPKN